MHEQIESDGRSVQLRRQIIGPLESLVALWCPARPSAKSRFSPPGFDASEDFGASGKPGEQGLRSCYFQTLADQ